MRRDTEMQSTRDIHVAQVNAVDSRGGAAMVALNLHRRYAARPVVSGSVVVRSSFVVGDNSGIDAGVDTLPNHDSKPWFVRSLLSAAAGLEHTNGRVPGTWRAAQALRRLAEPARQRDLRQGIEDFNAPGTWRLLDLFDTPPDVLHLHNLHGGYFDLRVLPWLSERVPTIVTLHDAWLLAGHCAHSFGCERWRHGCGQCPDLSIFPAIRRDATAFNWQHKRDIFRRSRLHVATPCRWLMHRVEQSILAEGMVEARVIPNGVDLNMFRSGDPRAARAALGLPRGARVLLFTADGVRNSQWKDYDTLRQAVAQVADRLANEQVIFVALGEGGASECVGRAEIRFAGYQANPATVARHYQAADAYLHAAKADTFPSVVLEALACGTPVVATNVGGIGEQVDDGVTGHLVPPGDFGALADRVIQLLSDAPRRRAMGVAASATAARRFSLDRQADAYAEWYTRLVNRNALKQAA
jgi:glycosyltransferase involved in cell wall biosynthesis